MFFRIHICLVSASFLAFSNGGINSRHVIFVYESQRQSSTLFIWQKVALTPWNELGY